MLTFFFGLKSMYDWIKNIEMERFIDENYFGYCSDVKLPIDKEEIEEELLLSSVILESYLCGVEWEMLF